MKKVQLIFPRHELGTVVEGTLHPPPIGLLTLGAYLKSKMQIDIEVYDGNTISDESLLGVFDGDVIGFSCWFSNYNNGIRLAEQIRAQNKKAMLIMGGPHTFGLAQRILRNNSCIDLVVRGDAEEAFADIIQGKPYEHIHGLTYRNGDSVKENEESSGISLDKIPIFDFSILKTRYQWNDVPTTQSAMPVSGVRGCSRIKRCEYCAIPTLGVRTQNPSVFWKQLGVLHEKYGIDYFFETGDIFPIKHAQHLAEVSNKPEVALRIYSYPGLINKENVEALAQINVRNVFIGVESVLIWERERQDTRRYALSYTEHSIHQEIELLERYGITVLPSFILGLPKETAETLEKNMELIREIARHPNVSDIVVNKPVPFPGTGYFRTCLTDKQIGERYKQSTGQDIQSEDMLDYDKLSDAFIRRVTTVDPKSIASSIAEIQSQYTNVAYFFKKTTNF